MKCLGNYSGQHNLKRGRRHQDRSNHSLSCPHNLVYSPNNALARSRQHRHPAKEEDSVLSPKARRQKLGNINSCKGAKGGGVKNYAPVGWRNLRNYNGLVSLSYSSYSFHTQGARDLLWAIFKYSFWKFFTVTRVVQKGRVFHAGSSLRGGKIYRLATNAKASDRTRKKKPQPVVQKLNSAIHWINFYQVDNIIGFPNTYSLHSDLSDGQRHAPFEQPGIFYPLRLFVLKHWPLKV